MTAFKDRVVQAVSGTPGTGTITLGAAQTGKQALGAGDDAKTWDCLATDTGDAWETFIDGLYTHSGISMTRGTFVSSSTGSPLNLTSAAIVSVSPSAVRAAQWTRYSRGGIVGLGLAYNSTTALDIAAGECMINGQSIVYAGGTVTSASTMKNLNNATVTIGASKAYHVYVTNGAGGLPAICIQDYAEATYGGAPVYDSANDYYKAAYATVGINARRIGKIWTDGSSHIYRFSQAINGRTRITDTGATISVLSGGTSAIYASVTLTPFITADDIRTGILAVCGGTGVSGGLTLSVDGGNSSSKQIWQVSLSQLEIELTGNTLSYMVSSASVPYSLYLQGFGEYV